METGNKDKAGAFARAVQGYRDQKVMPCGRKRAPHAGDLDPGKCYRARCEACYPSGPESMKSRWGGA